MPVCDRQHIGVFADIAAEGVQGLRVCARISRRRIRMRNEGMLGRAAGAVCGGVLDREGAQCDRAPPTRADWLDVRRSNSWAELVRLCGHEIWLHGFGKFS